MPLRVSTGDKELDGKIARQVRYQQARRAEVLLSGLMVAVGISLLWPGKTFSLPSFRVIGELMSEGDAGTLALCCGITRIWAIWMNGRRQMPLIRLAGCAIGFFFWLGWVWGFSHTVPPMVPLFPMSVVLAFAELMALEQTARDAYAYNSYILGRKRGRRNGGH